VTAWKDRHFLKHKTKTMYNTLLERQANDAKDNIKSVIDDLMTEINEIEEAHIKLEDKIDELEDIIILLKAQVQELESKLDKSF
jgi:predicted  nucleic acid-binding Zn-ribbon protein